MEVLYFDNHIGVMIDQADLRYILESCVAERDDVVKMDRLKYWIEFVLMEYHFEYDVTYQ